MRDDTKPQDSRVLPSPQGSTADALPPEADHGAPDLATMMGVLNGTVYRCRNDDNWTMLYLSSGCKQLTGYEASDLLHNREISYAQLINPDDDEHVTRTVREALAEKRAFTIDYRILAANGDERWVRERGYGLHDGSGKVELLEGFITDITEEKEADEEIRLLSETLKSIAEAVTVTDLDNRIRYANDAFLSTYGYTREEIDGLPIDRIRVDEDDSSAPSPETIARETLRGGWTGELLNQRRDGRRFPVLLSTSTVRDAAGQAVALIGVTRDLTRERKLQGQLRQAQRMEALGQLSSGVAHDFNNLLTVIFGYTELLGAGMEPTSPGQGAVKEITRAAGQAASLTKQLLAFSREGLTQPKVMNLNRQIIETEKMLRRLISENIVLSTSLASDLGLIRADPGQIDQILLNLSVNAKDAMPHGGGLSIATANYEAAEGFAADAEMAPGPYVRLEVRDSGCGMDAATLERIFEPFFTTKGSTEGTGLGLATVFGIVKQNGGYVLVESAPGEGTSFEIYLPRVADEVSPGAEPDGSVEEPEGSETILVVDDTASVRRLTARFLRTAGYTVLEARDAEEAMATAGGHPDDLALLITDIGLPGMDGCELAQQLHATRPEIEVIYASGHNPKALDWQGVSGRRVRFLQKPFRCGSLLDIVRQTLDERAD